MRTRVRIFARALFLLAVIHATGCATTPETSAPAGAGAATGESVITVQNNHSAFTSMTIFLEPEAGGARQSLGSVETGQSGNFSLVMQRGWYTLVAQHAGGDLRSERFHVAGRSTVTWDLRQNRVRVATRS